jgi:hypothetical protein
MGEAGFHGAVSEFKRRLIEATLCQFRGNRSQAARALGLQRTYLLRLIRDLGVTAPPAPTGTHALGARTRPGYPLGRESPVSTRPGPDGSNPIDTPKTPGVK